MSLVAMPIFLPNVRDRGTLAARLLFAPRSSGLLAPRSPGLLAPRSSRLLASRSSGEIVYVTHDPSN